MKGLLLGLALGCGGLLTAQTPAPQPLSSDAGVAAAQAWIGRALILRGACLGGELEFDAAGRVKGVPKTTDWTLAGMDLTAVSRRGSGELELDGIRVFIGYNQGGHVFERHPQKDMKLRVMIPGAASASAVDAEMAAVFSQGEDPAFERVQPPHWSHYFLPQQPWPDDTLKGVAILGLNGKVPVDLVMPVPEKKPEAEITPEARNAHIRGTVQAMMVVDTAGMPSRIVLRNPLGWGLDQQVADTLTHYRFKPGTLNGQPVATEVIINEEFQ